MGLYCNQKVKVSNLRWSCGLTLNKVFKINYITNIQPIKRTACNISYCTQII
uniref:Uncharacterized protein n=1 Tax=Anguilla anguilla TaxID=7936 RepID=A0A0E9S611_ANGAN